MKLLPLLKSKNTNDDFQQFYPSLTPKPVRSNKILNDLNQLQAFDTTQVKLTNPKSEAIVIPMTKSNTLTEKGTICRDAETLISNTSSVVSVKMNSNSSSPESNEEVREKCEINLFI